MPERAVIPMRSGRYIKQPTGYRAFIPAALPPDPPIATDAKMMTKLLSDADRALGRLDGVATVLPNPELFVAMYVREEAVLSSQIEGTQSTLEDVLSYGTANSIVEKLQQLGVLREITGQERNQKYQYESYVRLFDAENLEG